MVAGFGVKTALDVALRTKLAKQSTSGELQLFVFVLAMWLAFFHLQLGTSNASANCGICTGTCTSLFDYCKGRCRHNSESVVRSSTFLTNSFTCFSNISECF